MDSEKIVHKEEQQSTSIGSDSIGFRSFSNEFLGLDSGDNLDLNFSGNLLGFLEVENQLDVGKDILWGIGESVKQISFQFSKLDLVLVLVIDKLSVLSSKIGSFHLNNNV